MIIKTLDIIFVLLALYKSSSLFIRKQKFIDKMFSSAMYLCVETYIKNFIHEELLFIVHNNWRGDKNL